MLGLGRLLEYFDKVNVNEYDKCDSATMWQCNNETM